jgi:hypothetical protein
LIVFALDAFAMAFAIIPAVIALVLFDGQRPQIEKEASP